MTKFFIKPDQIIDDVVTIAGSDVQHIARVLRLKPGEMIQLADGSGGEYQAEIMELDQERVTALIRQHFHVQNEPPLAVYLFQGLPKGDKFDFIIQKCTEIGVQRIYPIAAARSIVHLTREKEEKRRERWQRIAEEAAKQSGRGAVPEVMMLMDLKDALETLPAGTTVLMPWEEESTGHGLKKLLRSAQITGPVVLVIGPEGGLAQTEVDLARQKGAITVSLGPRILRTETAGGMVVALSLLLYELGDLGGMELE